MKELATTEPSAPEDPSDPEISLSALEKAAEDVPEDHQPIIGEQFGKYVLVGEIGVGGMAEVFLAIQTGLQGFLKVVTLKRVLPHLASHDFIAMFIDEARIAARLEHPNIVKTFEFGETEGQYYTVMEYLAGEDLGSMMNRAAISKQPMAFNMAAMVVAQLCNGLHFAHELTDTAGRPLGLVHRDINPSNIIVTYAGEVKVIDFGVAKFNSSGSKTMTGTIKGKLAYMSPEQILARGIDRRSDIFSLGVVLWELVTGCRLFARESDAATLYAIMNDPIPKSRRHRPNVPEDLEKIISTALARTPADRYETCEEMQIALDQFLTTQPKFDSRSLAGSLESLFGSTRAEAKRAIAATRALSKNVSLVMKLRTEVRSDLAKSLTVRQHIEPVTRARRAVGGIAVVVLVATLAGLGYLLLGNPQPTKPTPVAKGTALATLKIDSRPSDAAISVRGEPTGLKTPATLTGIKPDEEFEVGVELPGYKAMKQRFTLKSGESTDYVFDLGSDSETPRAGGQMGQIVLAGLPSGATINIGGNDYEAGEVISMKSGRHQIRISVNGKMIVQQMLETGGGHQVWELREGQLVRK
ncbi:MAG TPA: serine/threonine-protein kinase [Kofleriaceae bacterium]|nr:serine/threonine-protein kinase [Kofleriaceae bacterium]